MAKGPEIPKTDSAEIDILIERLKQNKLEQRDVELIERLLRTVMALVNLLQRKNMSIKRLRDLIFGRRTEKRKTGSVSQPEDKPEEGAGSDPGAERECFIFRHTLSYLRDTPDRRRLTDKRMAVSDHDASLQGHATSGS